MCIKAVFVFSFQKLFVSYHFSIHLDVKEILSTIRKISCLDTLCQFRQICLHKYLVIDAAFPDHTQDLKGCRKSWLCSVDIIMIMTVTMTMILMRQGEDTLQGEEGPGHPPTYERHGITGVGHYGLNHVHKDGERQENCNTCNYRL